MTVSFMQFYKNIKSAALTKNGFMQLAILWILALVALPLLADSGGNIQIKSFDFRKSTEGFRIDVLADITLNQTLEDALKKGVELVFMVNASIMKPRWYWLDEEVARCRARFRLSYHALTRQYRLLQNEQLHSFASLNIALKTLGRQVDLPFKEYTPLLPNREYYLTLQISLDVSRLPKPFQMEWFDSEDWNLVSERVIRLIMPTPESGYLITH
ncbi:putative proline rich signal peptide protein [Nitrosomonas mobilis]|uniref:Putative proline rich signal peptide protein n=2 Tax=Nitrosomonas mobilis TaxID=51642 RepID=A0A1G5SGE4_9PROT|nr:putative proline rich signal peptide protein [Nitrosomonas mobilis]